MVPKRTPPSDWHRDEGRSQQLRREQSTPNRGEAPRSLRGAIDAKCKSCVYDQQSGLGTWREQVAACSCTGCPLYAVRPLPRYRTIPSTVEAGGTSEKAAPIANVGRH